MADLRVVNPEDTIIFACGTVQSDVPEVHFIPRTLMADDISADQKAAEQRAEDIVKDFANGRISRGSAVKVRDAAQRAIGGHDLSRGLDNMIGSGDPFGRITCTKTSVEIDHGDRDISADFRDGTIEVGIGHNYSGRRGYEQYTDIDLTIEEARAFSNWLLSVLPIL
jgi:hypothetical protein